jgi:hypothetical protein
MRFDTTHLLVFSGMSSSQPLSDAWRSGERDDPLPIFQTLDLGPLGVAFFDRHHHHPRLTEPRFQMDQILMIL